VAVLKGALAVRASSAVIMQTRSIMQPRSIMGRLVTPRDGIRMIDEVCMIDAGVRRDSSAARRGP
jgi:hypothetical protein